jgi:hypothetical protein
MAGQMKQASHHKLHKVAKQLRYFREVGSYEHLIIGDIP